MYMSRKIETEVHTNFKRKKLQECPKFVIMDSYHIFFKQCQNSELFYFVQPLSVSIMIESDLFKTFMNIESGSDGKS
jgi:hypothetical protein